MLLKNVYRILAVLREIKTLLILCIVFTHLAASAEAGPEDAFFMTAQTIYNGASASVGNDRVAALKKVRTILDGIVDDFPESDMAIRILLQDNIDGLDILALDEELSDAAEQNSLLMAALSVDETNEEAVIVADPFADAATAKSVQNELTLNLDCGYLSNGVSLPAATVAMEQELGLNRQAVRDVQARLLVIGHDPNGVDGSIGEGTRKAIRKWQIASGSAPTGYLNARQLVALKQCSEPQLTNWLEDKENKKLYEPPPPISLTPLRLSGRWSYTSSCGPRSKLGRMKIRGAMTLKHAGGDRYVGSLVNSQGLRARIDGRLNGRNVSASANFGFLFGKARLSARIDDHQLVARGRDSNGCSFYASK